MEDVSQTGLSRLRLVETETNPGAPSAKECSSFGITSERAVLLPLGSNGAKWKSVGAVERDYRSKAPAMRSDLSRFPFGGGAFTGERLLNARSSQGVWRLDAVEQPIRTGFKKLRKPGERCQRDGIVAPFDVADGFPMHAHQLSETLLSHVGLQPSVSNLLADQSEHLSVSHTSSWNGYVPLLTPRIASIKSWPSIAKSWIVTARQRGAVERSLVKQYERGHRMTRILPQLQHPLSGCCCKVFQTTPRCNERLKFFVR
jgi:hypothetical protein